MGIGLRSICFQYEFPRGMKYRGAHDRMYCDVQQTIREADSDNRPCARAHDRACHQRALLLDMIETGEVRHKDESGIWIAKQYADRADNMLCAAAMLETALVIKTAMPHFSWEPSS